MQLKLATQQIKQVDHNRQRTADGFHGGRQVVGRRNGVLISVVRPLQLSGAHARLLALLQQQLELRHLHLGRQTGWSILVSN